MQISALGGTAPTSPSIGNLFAQTEQPFIKLCGITDPAHAILIGQLQGDAFGMVFAPSRRQVTREQAAAIVNSVQQEIEGKKPLAVGVFVNESNATIADITQKVGLQAIQLSGDESPQTCRELISLTGLPIIKAVRLSSLSDLDSLVDYVSSGITLLLDTPHSGSYGGTGQVGNWELAREAAKNWPIILAGGLHPGNIEVVLAMVAPHGIDVSSGIETGGVKDAEKIRLFLATARRHRLWT